VIFIRVGRICVDLYGQCCSSSDDKERNHTICLYLMDCPYTMKKAEEILLPLWVEKSDNK
jgi:hypothetical protein